MHYRSAKFWVAVFFLVLLVNTAYVAAFSSATVFYMSNVLAHVVLGTVLAVGALFVCGGADGCAGRPRLSDCCSWPAFWELF